MEKSEIISTHLEFYCVMICTRTMFLDNTPVSVLMQVIESCLFQIQPQKVVKLLGFTIQI